MKSESGSSWIWRAQALPHHQATGLDLVSGQWRAWGRAWGRKRLEYALGNHLSMKQAFIRVLQCASTGGDKEDMMEGQHPGVSSLLG